MQDMRFQLRYRLLPPITTGESAVAVGNVPSISFNRWQSAARVGIDVSFLS
jgi:hypothetical protein